MRFRDSTSLKVPISLVIQANLNGVAMWLSERAEKYPDFDTPGERFHQSVTSTGSIRSRAPMTSQAEGGQKQVFDTPARSLTIDWTVAPAMKMRASLATRLLQGGPGEQGHERTDHLKMSKSG